MRLARRLLITFTAIGLVPILLAARGSVSHRVIAVVKSRNLAPYNQALLGLRQILDASDPSLEVRELELPSEDVRLGDFMNSLRQVRPNLIVTIGTQATRVVSESIRDVPVVFSLILANGESEALWRSRPVNVTGAAMDIPIALQFARMKEVIPSLKRVGVIYNPVLTRAAIQEARAAAETTALTLVEIPVSSEAEVISEIENLKGRVDALWSVADSTVFTPRSVDTILLLTLRDSIPFVGLSPSFVKAGALLSFSCDYADVGGQSGEIALQVLAGKTPSEIAVVYPRRVAQFLNMNTAHAIHLEIPERIQAESHVEFRR